MHLQNALSMDQSLTLQQGKELTFLEIILHTHGFEIDHKGHNSKFEKVNFFFSTLFFNLECSILLRKSVVLVSALKCVTGDHPSSMPLPNLNTIPNNCVGENSL